MNRENDVARIDENSAIPLRTVSAIAGVAIAGAVAWMAMSARVDFAQADIRSLKEEVLTTKRVQDEMLKSLSQDRIEEAAFKSAVMTKLDRIEKKLDK
jgi:hypothetical protein